jgi:hypothetical protein
MKAEQQNIEQEKERQVEERRLDSLATLIEGPLVCGAVYFDKSSPSHLTIKLANNKTVPLGLVEATITHLKYVAQIAKEFSEQMRPLLNPSLEASGPNSPQARALRKEFLNNIDESQQKWQTFIKLKDFKKPGKRRGKAEKAASDMNKYKQLAAHAMEKITDLIIADTLTSERTDGVALGGAFVDALLRPGGIEYIESDQSHKESSSPDIHAEMTLTHNILRKVFSEDIREKSFKLGISKKCCKTCSLMLEAVNEVLSERRVIIEPSEPGHGVHYPSGVPYFLHDNDLPAEIRQNIVNSFLRIAASDLDYGAKTPGQPLTLQQIYQLEHKKKGNITLKHPPSPVTPRNYVATESQNPSDIPLSSSQVSSSSTLHSQAKKEHKEEHKGSLSSKKLAGEKEFVLYKSLDGYIIKEEENYRKAKLQGPPREMSSASSMPAVPSSSSSSRTPLPRSNAFTECEEFWKSRQDQESLYKREVVRPTVSSVISSSSSLSSHQVSISILGAQSSSSVSEPALNLPLTTIQGGVSLASSSSPSVLRGTPSTISSSQLSTEVRVSENTHSESLTEDSSSGQSMSSVSAGTLGSLQAPRSTKPHRRGGAGKNPPSSR